MPLKAKINSLSDVPEDAQELYRPLPNDGGFVLDVIESDGFALENISGLRNTLQSQKRDLQSFKDQMSAFEGVDANTLRSDLRELQRLRELDPKELAKDQVQQAIDAERKKFEGLIGNLEGKVAGKDTVISGLLVDTHAQQALAEAGGSAKLLLPHIKSQCKVVEMDNGQMGVQVMDHNGNPRIAIENGQTRDFTISDLINEMRHDDVFAVGFQARGKSGTGGPSDHQSYNENRQRVIRDGGHESVSQNLEAIAKGEVIVDIAD